MPVRAGIWAGKVVLGTKDGVNLLSVQRRTEKQGKGIFINFINNSPKLWVSSDVHVVLQNCFGYGSEREKGNDFLFSCHFFQAEVGHHLAPPQSPPGTWE